ncbi:hypothetical protein IEO21_02135 [Rhodonia placenta]|uniref:RBR-type E3 ubiquitin transferase n=1 Tax=Rhodonia placenta TaxID=104341 RepID=A0A8H7P8F8_9APHY|nr:hypothetical protein IEO21_02135 [Postia placenta]
MSGDADVLSELLIARILEEEMLALSHAQEAEKLQVDLMIDESDLLAGKGSGKHKAVAQEPISDSDGDLVLKMVIKELRMSSDATLAQALQHSDDVTIIAGQQHAQRLAAGEKKLLLDAEFARRLQAVDDNANADIDTAEYMDAETVLGRETIEQLLASDPNDKGKKSDTGKGKGKSPVLIVLLVAVNKDVDVPSVTYPICGICMEPFQATHSPLASSASANSSARLKFGLCLPCPGVHAYCMGCLGDYIRSKLDPDGDETTSMNRVVFPIRCPECPLIEWANGIPDEVATRILPEKTMGLWHHQKLLDSMPRYYCPNPRCSALVQVHDDPNDPLAQCPSCNSRICVPCRVVWHENLTCEEYQALPLDERSPEDQQALQLMKAQHWRRCPNCSFIVELTVGCNHITCRCKTEFCFRCGSLWDVRRKRCIRNPACDLWDEEMLLEERERERERRQGRVAAAVRPVARMFAPHEELPPPYEAPPVPPVRRAARGTFDWMDDPCASEFPTNIPPNPLLTVPYVRIWQMSSARGTGSRRI